MDSYDHGQARDMSSPALRLSALGTEIHLRPGERLELGTSGDAFALVLWGRPEAEIGGVTLTLEGGSVVDCRDEPCTIKAVDPTVILCLADRAFDSLVEAEPGLAGNVLTRVGAFRRRRHGAGQDAGA